jgi:2-polyprenyl-6-hydroxyphenyl methylase / 3-demethylubiquinone-9 3-methyltransferase
VTFALVPIGLQAIAMIADEGWCHRRRELPRWERIGHPLDTLTLALCLGWLLAGWPLAGYVVLAIASTLFVTKDEAVHAQRCTAFEHWLHAVLFALHPIVLAAFAYLAWTGHTTVLAVQLAVTLGFMAYQIAYWNLRRPRAVNNAWYADLGARWYEADDTPIALLRAEARHRNPWLGEAIARELGPRCRVLDLGCGAGLLANYLAARGHDVIGIDSTPENLAIARTRGDARFELGDATALDEPDASFDVVCALDLLEHVEDPSQVVTEAARVLKPGGLFVFHTFNRTWQANLIVIKGVAWFVRNAPDDLHVLRLFIRPEELSAMCRDAGLEIVALTGSRPRFRWPLWRMLFTGRVGDDFAFTWTRSTKLGYTGIARRWRSSTG